MDSQKLNYLQDKAAQIRKITIEMIGRLGSGHVGGSLSIVDVLTDIYYNAGNNMDASNPGNPDRDRVVVSKGHAGPALYAVLAEKGYFPMEYIKTLNKGGTCLPSHCDMNKTPGVDMTAGSLGQGLSCAVGMALAAKIDNKSYRTYCIIGDGESQEGQIWEALMYAGNMRLNNLTIFIDYNKMQIDGYTDEINSLEPLPDKYRAFNLNTIRVDGHDIAAIDDAIEAAKSVKDKCSIIILDTVKGYGVPWAADKKVGSHSFAISEAQWREYCGKEEE